MKPAKITFSGYTYERGNRRLIQYHASPFLGDNTVTVSVKRCKSSLISKGRRVRVTVIIEDEPERKGTPCNRKEKS